MSASTSVAQSDPPGSVALSLRGPAVSAEALAVHKAGIPIDLHADTTKFLSRGYDFYRRHDPPWPAKNYGGHVDLPRMQEGHQGGQFFAMWTFPIPEGGCHADLHRQIDALERTIEQGNRQGGGHGSGQTDGPGLVLCKSADEIRAAKQAGKVAALLGIEGGHALGRKSEAVVIERLTALARRGVRYLGLLHFSRSALGSPAYGFRADPHAGLTSLGSAVVEACVKLGVIVDLAHINRRGFFDVVERKPGPLFVTHTGVAGVHRHWRNIDDEQLKAVADSGGVVGVIFAPRFLGKDGLEGVVEHLLHIRDVVGEDAVGLGSDWDGFVRPTTGLESPAGLPHLTEALLRRGVRAEAVHKILGENVLRVLSAVPCIG